MDHVLLWAREMDDLQRAVSAAAGVPPERVAITFSHTHAAGLMGLERVELPGGDLIPGYLCKLGEKIGGIVRAARANVQAANITYATGRCTLARHRDFWDEETRQFVCGFNPDRPADDTVLLARVSGAAGQPLALLVNYACHPTTLAWDNTLISPDFPGAMRDLVEREAGVVCVFLQGASGDLGPREGYVGDVRVAERNGRQLGHAVLAAWEEMPPPATRYRYTGPVVSGATIGTWAHETLPPEELAALARWQRRRATVDLAYRPDLPTAAQTQDELQHWQEEERRAQQAGDAQAARDSRAMVERIVRRLAKLDALPPGPTFPFPVLVWRVGDGVWLALQGELYSWFQVALRQRFPNVPLFVLTLTNDWRPAYLPTADAYGKGIYQETVAVLAPGCLERLLGAVCDLVKSVL
jgi:hypothetical protein